MGETFGEQKEVTAPLHWSGDRPRARPFLCAQGYEKLDILPCDWSQGQTPGISGVPAMIELVLGSRALHRSCITLCNPLNYECDALFARRPPSWSDM